MADQDYFVAEWPPKGPFQNKILVKRQLQPKKQGSLADMWADEPGDAPMCVCVRPMAQGDLRDPQTFS